MIALLQRVTTAHVDVAGKRIAAIGRGLLALVAVERGDGMAQADRLYERILGYRLFCDETGRMNRSLAGIGGELLLVPQFTLAADTRKGTRPSFTPAAPPEIGQRIFDHLLAAARRGPVRVAAGRFGADMQVGLVNDGPVTISLRVSPD